MSKDKRNRPKICYIDFTGGGGGGILGVRSLLTVKITSVTPKTAMCKFFPAFAVNY